jgi:hypothetical protein
MSDEGMMSATPAPVTVPAVPATALMPLFAASVEVAPNPVAENPNMSALKKRVHDDHGTWGLELHEWEICH